jgi:homoserine kinase
VRIEPPKDLGVVVAMPDVLVSTKEARAVLPAEVSVKSLVFHVGNASCMAYAMMSGNIDLIGRSAKDAVFEPARAHLIPYLKEAESVAMSLGAKASFLGGSGPCVISFFSRTEHNGAAIADGIKEMYSRKNMGCDTWVTEWGNGCRRL